MWYVMLCTLLTNSIYGAPEAQADSVEMQRLLSPDQTSSTQAHFYYAQPTHVHHATSLAITLQKRKLQLSKRICGCIPWTVGQHSNNDFFSSDKLHSVDLTHDYAAIILGLDKGTIMKLNRVTKPSLCAAASYRVEKKITVRGEHPCVAIGQLGNNYACSHFDESQKQSIIRVWTKQDVNPTRCEIDGNIEVLLIGNTMAVAGSSTCIYSANLMSKPLLFIPVPVHLPQGEHTLRLGLQEQPDTLLISDNKGKLLKSIPLEQSAEQG